MAAGPTNHGLNYRYAGDIPSDHPSFLSGRLQARTVVIKFDEKDPAIRRDGGKLDRISIGNGLQTVQLGNFRPINLFIGRTVAFVTYASEKESNFIRTALIGSKKLFTYIVRAAEKYNPHKMTDKLNEPPVLVLPAHAPPVPTVAEPINEFFDVFVDPTVAQPADLKPPVPAFLPPYLENERDNVPTEPKLVEELRQWITCIVCREVSRSNVGFCPNQHHICRSCFGNLPNVVQLGRLTRNKACPYCLVEFIELKPLPVANSTVLTYVPLPCKNDIYGCSEKLLLAELGAHESNDCQYQQLNCPLNSSDCAWNGQANEVVNHIYNQHPNVYFVSDKKKCRLHLQVTQTQFDWYIAFSFDEHCILMHARMEDAIFNVRFQSHLTKTKAKTVAMPSVRIRFVSFATPGQWQVFSGVIDCIDRGSFKNSVPILVDYLIDNYIRDSKIIFEIKFN